MKYCLGSQYGIETCRAVEEENSRIRSEFYFHFSVCRFRLIPLNICHGSSCNRSFIRWQRCSLHAEI